METTVIGETEFKATIAMNRWALFQANLAKLNRRLLRSNLPTIEVEAKPAKCLLVQDERSGLAFHVSVRDVVVRGLMIKLGDFRLLASIEHNCEPKRFRTFGGVKIPPEFLIAAPACDHCKTSRRRSKTFVLGDSSGKYLHIGGSCLEEFTGRSPADALAATAVWTEFDSLMRAELGMMEDGEGGFGSAPKGAVFPLLEILAVACQCIARSGWVSSSRAKESLFGPTPLRSTAEEVRETWETCWGPEARPEKELAVDARQAWLDHAQAVVSYWQEKLPISPIEELDDLHANIWSCVHARNVQEEQLGVAVFAVHSFQMAMRPPAAERPPSEWLGTVGQALQLEVKVEGLHQLEGAWGISTLHRLSDAGGNDLTWFCSGKPLEAGQTLRIKGKVKSHSLYDGRKQTVLTRVKQVV